MIVIFSSKWDYRSETKIQRLFLRVPTQRINYCFSLLTKPKVTGEGGDEKTETQENGENSTETKEEPKASTPFNLANIKSDAISPLLKLAAAQQQAAAQNAESEIKTPLDTIKSFGLERFSGSLLVTRTLHQKYTR